MTPQGGPSMPFIGHCVRCGNPVFGAHVAFPAGPAHPECARASQAKPRSNGVLGSPALKVVFWGGFMLAAVLGFVLFLRKTAKDSEKRKAAEAAAAASAENAAADAKATLEEKERPAFLYCDPRQQYCEQPELSAVNLYATEPDYFLRNGIDCRRSPKKCAPPSKPSLTLAPGTKVTVLPMPVARVYRQVRLEDGPNKAKVGLVDPKYVHDEPRR